MSEYKDFIRTLKRALTFLYSFSFLYTLTFQHLRQHHFDFSYFLRDALNTSSLLLHLTQRGVIHGQQNVCITCSYFELSMAVYIKPIAISL
jgi:hypothetical protein